jgi:ABC-type sugar transport system permease subunit
MYYSTKPVQGAWRRMTFRNNDDIFRISQRSWPSFALILGWVLCAIFILGGLFLVFSLAVQFGNDVTYQFMTAFIVSFFCSVFITYPLYVIWQFLIKSELFDNNTSIFGPFSDYHWHLHDQPLLPENQL